MFSPSSDQIDAFHNALNELAEPDCYYTSFAFFSAAEIDAMIQQTSSLLFRTATAVVGNNVHQDMEVCFPAPRQGIFDECATLLETIIHGWSGFKDHILPDLRLPPSPAVPSPLPLSARGAAVPTAGSTCRALPGSRMRLTSPRATMWILWSR